MNATAQIAVQEDGKFTNIEKWAITCLVALSFTGISIIDIGKAMLTPFHIIMGFQIGYAIVVSKLDRKTASFTLFLFMLYVTFLNIYQYQNIRFTSVLYTLIYGIEITILINLLVRCRIRALLFGLQCIVYLYFANLLLGFCFDLINFKNPTVLKYIRVYYSIGEGGGRPMGFSSEPSYASFLLAVTLLCFSHLRGHLIDKKTFIMFGLTFMSIVFTKSAYGFLFIMIVLLDWLFVFYNKGDGLLKSIFPLILVLGLSGVVFLASYSENEAIQRLNRFTTCLFDTSVKGKKKLKQLQEADGSAFARIAPTYLLFFNDGEAKFNFTIGQGAGSAGKYLSKFLVGILVDEGRESVDTGIMPALIFDYGYIGSFIFLLFLIFTFYGLPGSFWLLFILIIPNANINTQLIWFAIACYAYVSKLKLLNSNT